MEQRKQRLSSQGGNKLVDLNAPIIPWKGMGNIELYSHLKDFYEYINKSRPKILKYTNLLRLKKITLTRGQKKGI